MFQTILAIVVGVLALFCVLPPLVFMVVKYGTVGYYRGLQAARNLYLTTKE